MIQRTFSILMAIIFVVSSPLFLVPLETAQAASPLQSISPPDDDFLRKSILATYQTQNEDRTPDFKIANVRLLGTDGLVDYYDTATGTGKIAVIVFLDGGWHLYTENNRDFDQELTDLPETLLSKENKSLFYTQQSENQISLLETYTGHKLPWEGGVTRKVTQTPTDHTGVSDWAYDFSMNVGTPLWASRSGIVALVKENSSTGGCSSTYGNMANYVVINNDGDNSATLYLHLNTNGVVVSVGQHVNQGDLIGYSGQTGFSCGAHLHYQVQSRGSWWSQSQRVIFDSPIGEPAKNAMVVSNNYRTPPTANCSNPTASDVYVCNPQLTPTYNGNTCTSYWYKFTGYENQPAYVTLNAYDTSTSSNSAVWRPNLPSTGTYEIFAHIGQHGSIDRNCNWSSDTVSTDTSRAKYRVYGSGSTLLREVEVNQSPYANQWVSLGQVSLPAGNVASVKLTDVTGETRVTRNVSFGAMRFHLVTPTCYTLTVSTAPENAGTVSLSQYSSGSCPTGSYAPGTVVTATANAGSGYQFTQWSGASSSSGKSISMTVDGNKTLTANFIQAVYNTNWMPDSVFTGETAASTGQIRTFLRNRGSCLADPITDTDGKLLDVPAWIQQNAVTHQINPKVLLATMEKEQSAISSCPAGAKLDRLMGIENVATARGQIAASASLYRAYMNDQASGGATVKGWAAGLETETLDGVIVTPASKAIAALFSYTAYAGEQWGGDTPGIISTYLFKSAWDTYQFDQPFPVFTCHTLTITRQPEPGGQVSVSPASSTDCGNMAYPPNTVVQLIATPAAGYAFTGWTGDVNNPSATTLLTMDANKQLTASFQIEQGSNTPKLGIARNASGYSGGKAVVGVSFTGTADLISSTSLSIDYDHSCLAIRSDDQDQDGIPDAVQFSNLPGFSVGATLDPADLDGELDILISDFSIPFSTLKDGKLFDITFDVLCAPEAGAIITATVAFSQNPPVSFGNNQGESVPGTIENGSVMITSGQPGDVNEDKKVDAGDISALVLEIFDGDGNRAADTLGGTYPGSPIGSDSNRDSIVDAGDISCLVLLIFNGSGACGSPALSSLSSSSILLVEDLPELSLMTGTVKMGQAFSVPVIFKSNQIPVSSLAFSLDYDQTMLFLDSTDADEDGIPDAIQLNLPSGYTGSVSVDLEDNYGEIDVLLADLTAPLTQLPEGALVTIAFKAKSSAPGNTQILFSSNPAPSFGDIQGHSVNGVAANATITITESNFVFLPMLSR